MIRAFRAGPDGGAEIDPAAAIQSVLTDATAAVWIDLDSADEAATRTLLAPLNIHPLALEDMVAEVNRPKVDDYGSYLYLVVHSARWDDSERPTLREIDILVGERYLITYHEGSSRSLTLAREVLARRPELLARGPAHLMHFILDQMVDNYLPIMDRIAEKIDRLEEDVLHQAGRRADAQILKLKRGMAAMRRIVGPQRDTLLALTRDEFHAIPATLRPYLRDVYDRLARVGDLMDSYRDETAGLLELYVSMASARLNSVIKVLTVIATLIFPLTLVTGYYGMNFKFAEYEWSTPVATVYVLALLLIVGLGTWRLLKRNRWL